MHRLAIAIVAALLLAAPARAAEPGDAALDFVEAFADDHLSGMLSRIGGQSDAMRRLSAVDPHLVAATFDAEIDAAVARHHDAWARNLALAWDPLLTDAEMASLAESGTDSPHVEKYLGSREEAAAAMAGLSQDLFADILREVIGGTMRSLVEAAGQ